MLCVWDFMLGMTLKEFLKHFKESRGVLGQASRQSSKQAGKWASKLAVKQVSKRVSRQAGK